jgi:cell division protein FtsL
MSAKALLGLIVGSAVAAVVTVYVTRALEARRNRIAFGDD